MDRVLVGSAMLALIPLFWALMWRGWRRREHAQVEVPVPREPVAHPGEDGAPAWAGEPVEAVYVSTTLGGQPFERVTAHGLGSRSAALVGTTRGGPAAGPAATRPDAPVDGPAADPPVGLPVAAPAGVPVGRPAGALVVLRGGARSFEVPAADVVGVDRRRGMAGKFMFEKEGLVVVTWRSGGVELDTGLRCATRSGADRLVAEVSALVDAARGPVAGGGA